MGGRSSRQPYGALEKAPRIDHETYFKVKSSSRILVAFVVASEEVTNQSSAFSRVVIVTRSGIDIYNLKSAKLLTSARHEIVTATVGLQDTRAQVLAYAESDNTVYICDPTTAEVVKKMDFSEPVTALCLLAPKYLAVGLGNGAISWADLSTLAVAQIDTNTKQPVCIFSSLQIASQTMVIAGFKSDQKSKLYLFAHTEGAIQSHMTYESLPGSCADVAIVDSEKIVLGLCEGTGALYIWDLENSNYLLSINLSGPPLSRMLVFEASDSEGRMTLVLGGEAGIVVGLLHIGEGKISWVPKSKSQVASQSKVQPGAVCSLEHDKVLDLLTYGDQSGQVWLIPGLLSNQPRPSLVAKAGIVSSEHPLP